MEPAALREEERGEPAGSGRAGGAAALCAEASGPRGAHGRRPAGQVGRGRHVPG